MDLLTIEQIDEKIKVAQDRYDRAEDVIDRNVCGLVRDEYVKYRAERLRKLEKSRAEQ
jgi:hypothetical protein